MAGFCPWNWQHGLLAHIPGESHPCAIAPQQSGWLEFLTPSRQAEAGIAAQETTTANISNAPFLHQFIVFRSRESIVSIHLQASRDSDLDHVRGTRRS